MAALQLSEKYNPRHEDTANYIALRTRSSMMSPQGRGTLGIQQIVLPAGGMEFECRGLENRMSVFEVQIRSARDVVDANVAALDDHSAALEAWLAGARKVRDWLK